MTINRLDMDSAMPAIIRSIINRSIHTSTLGQVSSFNKDEQTAEIIPIINNRVGEEIVEYKKLADVPVIFPSSGRANISFPIVKGDIGLLVFAERSIDESYEKKGRATPIDPRRFSISDAIFIPGLSTNGQRYSDALEITLDELRIVVRNNKVAIGISGVELLDILHELIGTLTTTTAGGNPLSSAVALQALKTKLEIIKGDL